MLKWDTVMSMERGGVHFPLVQGPFEVRPPYMSLQLQLLLTKFGNDIFQPPIEYGLLKQG